MSNPSTLDPVLLELAIAAGKHAASTVRLSTVRAAAHLSAPSLYPLPEEPGALEVEISGWLSKMPEGRRKKVVAAAMAEVDAPPGERERRHGPFARMDLKSRVPIAKQAERLLPSQAGKLQKWYAARGKTQTPAPDMARGHRQGWSGIKFFIKNVLCQQTSGMGVGDDRVDVVGTAIDPSKFVYVPHASGAAAIDTTPGTQEIKDYIASMSADQEAAGEVQAMFSFAPWEPTAAQPFATWPRKYTAVMAFVVEADSDEEVESYAQKIIQKAVGAAAGAVTNALATAIGAVLGSPGGIVGVAIGAAVGAAVGAAIGELVDFIKSFFDSHLSAPLTYEVELPLTLGFPAGFTETSPRAAVTAIEDLRIAVNRGNYRIRTYWEISYGGGFHGNLPITQHPFKSPVEELGKLEPAIAIAQAGDHLFAAMSDGRIVARPWSQVDAAWTAVSTLSGVRALAALPGRLLATTGDGKLLVRSSTPTPGAEWTVLGPCPDAIALATYGDTSLYALASDGVLRKAAISTGEPSWRPVAVAGGARTLGASYHGRGSGSDAWGLYTLIEEDGAPPQLALCAGTNPNGGWTSLGPPLVSGIVAMTGTTISHASGALYFSCDDGVLRMLPTSRVM
jgi:hypothetical protein